MIKEGYYLLFYKLYKSFKFFSGNTLNGWEDWKSLAVISCLESLILVEIINWYTFITRKIVDLQIVWCVIPCGLITVVNYYIFLHDDKWKIYKIKLDAMSKRSSTFASFAIFFVLILILASIILSFYQLSKYNGKT